uniref:Uncharacterized protein n=1 Tax=Setaria viridis TaxID=4556 RepID=A0A4U6V4T8_SETVI|nr:hypothetical protein SEVIR_3G035300v2 [Setaria viridis]
MGVAALMNRGNSEHNADPSPVSRPPQRSGELAASTDIAQGICSSVVCDQRLLPRNYLSLTLTNNAVGAVSSSVPIEPHEQNEKKRQTFRHRRHLLSRRLVTSIAIVQCLRATMPPAIRRCRLPTAQPPRGAHPTIATHSAEHSKQQLATPVAAFGHSSNPFPRFLLQPCRTPA